MQVTEPLNSGFGIFFVMNLRQALVIYDKMTMIRILPQNFTLSANGCAIKKLYKAFA